MTTRHPSVSAVMQFFRWQHLPPELQPISRLFYLVATSVADGPQNPEATVALRHLLEAKDAAVAAAALADEAHKSCIAAVAEQKANQSMAARWHRATLSAEQEEEMRTSWSSFTIWFHEHDEKESTTPRAAPLLSLLGPRKRTWNIAGNKAKSLDELKAHIAESMWDGNEAQVFSYGVKTTDNTWALEGVIRFTSQDVADRKVLASLRISSSTYGEPDLYPTNHLPPALSDLAMLFALRANNLAMLLEQALSGGDRPRRVAEDALESFWKAKNAAIRAALPTTETP